MTFVYFILGYIGIFLAKNTIYKLLSIFVNTIRQYIEMAERPFIHSPFVMNNMSFVKIGLNFLMVAFFVILIVVEFGQLNVNMQVVFSDDKLDFFTSIHLSEAAAVIYIIITLVAGIFACDFLGVRKMVLSVLTDVEREDGSWNEFGSRQSKPSGLYRVVLGVVALVFLLYLANLQGMMGIERGVMDRDDAAIKDVDKSLFYALGFSTPVLAAVSFVSVEITLGFLAQLLVCLMYSLEKVFTGLYSFTKNILEIIFTPLKYLALILVKLFGDNIRLYVQPLGRNNGVKGPEMIMLKSHYKGCGSQKIIDEAADKKVNEMMEDDIDSFIDDLL